MIICCSSVLQGSAPGVPEEKKKIWKSEECGTFNHCLLIKNKISHIELHLFN